MSGPQRFVELECRHQVRTTKAAADQLNAGDGFRCPECKIVTRVVAIIGPTPDTEEVPR